MKKKRHHYVPQAYLRFFCDEHGRVQVYRKDDPANPVALAPNNTGFHKYYYSQPLPGGGKDHNSLENVFSEHESKWPRIVERIRLQENINDSLQDVFTFIALQRVRVPAMRDAIEKRLADQVKALALQRDAAGKLPPKPAGHEDILERVRVSIDPHQSLYAIVRMLPGIGYVLDQMGIGVLHNRTDIPFLTSDNPVIWFDPSVPEADMRPYVLRPHGPVVLLFPIAPDVLIYGHSSMRQPFLSEGLGHSDLTKRKSVKMMNRQICRFAYQAVFAQSAGQEAVIEKHAALSPVVVSQSISRENAELQSQGYAFGQRQKKPKWID